MSGAILAGFVAAWAFSACIVAIVAGRFFAVANPQHPRGFGQQQDASNRDPDVARAVPVGGEVNHIHSQDDY